MTTEGNLAEPGDPIKAPLLDAGLGWEVVNGEVIVPAYGDDRPVEPRFRRTTTQTSVALTERTSRTNPAQLNLLDSDTTVSDSSNSDASTDHRWELDDETRHRGIVGVRMARAALHGQDSTGLPHKRR